ncbi:MAG: N-formylglutamate amidohydrolase [Paracoccaceae bacterium]
MWIASDNDKAKRCIISVQSENSVALEIVGEARQSRWLVTCDHASNHVPDWINGGDLGICAGDMTRHIAYDVGAAGLALALAEKLGAPAVLSRFSRLVIDPNRGEDDPTLVMKLYDGTIIPANRHVDAARVEERLLRLYRPYHAALARMAARQADTVIVAIHSFTPCLKGRPARPWHVGVLHSHLDGRLSYPLLARLRAESDLCVGDNEPYGGHLDGDAIAQHALDKGRLNTLIEVRNDLIGDAAGQQAWSTRLAPILEGALRDAGT